MPDLFEAQEPEIDRDQRFRDSTTTTVQPTVINPVEPMLSKEAEIPMQQENSSDNAQTKQVQLGKMQRIKNKIYGMNLFTSFCENPTNVHFDMQEPDERVLVFMRKSNFLNLPWIVLGIFLAIVPLLLYSFRSLYTQITPPAGFIIILIPFYYILVLTYMFVHFLIWYYNVALVTTKRVIDIDFHELVLKEVNETKLDLVQDVSFRQDGVLENMFNYGYVLVQTAGTIDNFEFHGLPNPMRVEEVVQGLIGKGPKTV